MGSTVHTLIPHKYLAVGPDIPKIENVSVSHKIKDVSVSHKIVIYTAFHRGAHRGVL